MPYNPGISYRGGDYILAGLQSLGAGIGQFGSDIGDAMEKHRKEMEEKQKEQAQNQRTFDYVQKFHPDLIKDPQEAQKTIRFGSLAQQSGMADDWMREVADRFHQQTADREQQYQAAQIKNMQSEMGLREQQRQNLIAAGNDPFYRDWQGNPVAKRGAKGQPEALPEYMTPQAQQEAARKSYEAEMKARNLDPDIFGQAPRGKMSDTVEKNVPYIKGTMGDVFIYKGAPKGGTDNPNDPGQYSTFSAPAWNYHKQRYNNVYGINQPTQQGPQQAQTDAPQTQQQSQSKYTPQQLDLAKRASVDPNATPKQKSNAIAILQDAGQ